MILAAKNQSLELAAAQRLARFVQRNFNPKSDTSWQTLESMWKGALLARRIENQPEAAK